MILVGVGAVIRDEGMLSLVLEMVVVLMLVLMVVVVIDATAPRSEMRG